MAATQASSNRRIAKNTVALYLRMFFIMLVGIYTTRVVLNTLGVQDYGIYGVVGSVVAMMGFLNAAMAGATSRFLTFELGRGDETRLAKTFSSALIIHMGIALAVLVLAETVGLWFLCNKLVIPPERMGAAHWVYQLSILSAMIGITQVPYDAIIISHERMGVYAYVEILNSLLKLAIVYLLVLGHFDKLKLYAVLTLAVSVTIMMIYRIYCLRHFKETHFHWIWDKTYLKPMLSFSGWDLYGNACVTARQQGVNFLINMFFGVAYNAASSIASTIQGILLGLSHNILIAFRPQIIKLYASSKNKESILLLYRAAKFSTLILLATIIPLCIELDFILKLWLQKVPFYAEIFCKLMLVSGVFSILNSSINIGNHATGKIKMLSFVTGTLFLLTLPIIWIAFKLGIDASFAYITFIAINIVILLFNITILHHNNKAFSLVGFFHKCIMPIAIVAVLSFGSSELFKILCEKFQITSVYKPILVIFMSLLLSSLFTFYFGFTSIERLKVSNWITIKIHNLL
ncbi:MAG: polysaccharide biosynthesis protein [Muribaculaceae bacterium]|nr:polysaccharide biosynthesis protein [Muribaculaceae bacterium]